MTRLLVQKEEVCLNKDLATVQLPAECHLLLGEDLQVQQLSLECSIKSVWKELSRHLVHLLSIGPHARAIKGMHLK